MSDCKGYLNADGTKFDPVSMGVSIAIQTGVGFLFAQGQAQKNKELARKLSALNNQQQEELKNKVASVSTELKKTEVLFEYLNKVKESEIKKDITKKRILNFVFLGVGVVALIIVVQKLKDKNG
jgi:hypothetical protein